MGTLFEDLAAAGCRTAVNLGRPFDIAPERGTHHDIGSLGCLVRDAAGWLAAAGVGATDRVAIVKDNHWDIDLLACAAIRLGAVPALMSGSLSPEALRVLLERFQPHLLVTTAGMLEAGRRRQVDLVRLADRTVSIDGAPSGVLALDAVRGHDPPSPHRREPDDPLVVNHTSGTTGIPKLVVHSTTTIVRRLAEFEARRWPVIGYRPDDTVVSASSFAHARTFCWTAAVFMAEPDRVVISEDHDPAVAGPLLRTHRPTVLEGLPATYVRWQALASGEESPFSDVRLFISTYDAVHPTTVADFLGASQRRGALWAQVWGQTELGPLTYRFHLRPFVGVDGERRSAFRDQGWPIPLRTRLRVVDPETFDPLGRGEPGLILAKTGAQGLGYVGQRARWDDKCRGDWFNTGDLGIRTSLGSIALLDREVDRIPGTSCLAIEDVIDQRIPEVVECIVLGAPGRLPLPVVVTPDGSLDETGWKEAVGDLPPLDEPLVRTWDQVPRTGTGKVRRLQLREHLEDVGETHGTGRWT